MNSFSDTAHICLYLDSATQFLEKEVAWHVHRIPLSNFRTCTQTAQHVVHEDASQDQIKEKV